MSVFSSSNFQLGIQINCVPSVPFLFCSLAFSHSQAGSVKSKCSKHFIWSSKPCNRFISVKINVFSRWWSYLIVLCRSSSGSATAETNTNENTNTNTNSNESTNAHLNEKIIILHRTLLLVWRLGCTLVRWTLSGRRIKRQIKPPNVAETEMWPIQQGMNEKPCDDERSNFFLAWMTLDKVSVANCVTRLCPATPWYKGEGAIFYVCCCCCVI